MRYLASCEKLCQIQRIMLKHFLRENEMRDFSVLGLPVKNNQHRLVFEIIVNCVWFFFFICGGFWYILHIILRKLSALRWSFFIYTLALFCGHFGSLKLNEI